MVVPPMPWISSASNPRLPPITRAFKPLRCSCRHACAVDSRVKWSRANSIQSSYSLTINEELLPLLSTLTAPLWTGFLRFRSAIDIDMCDHSSNLQCECTDGLSSPLQFVEIPKSRAFHYRRRFFGGRPWMLYK